MSFSVNTNIASLQAQNYLRASSQFQSKTINQVTSGLRIVNSGDDAAGLAIANSFRSDESVLTQGIRNATDGISTLQTLDGGMNNISTLLDRARTLATQSASGTFTGDRNVLNQEFQNVLGEIDRQAQAIGLDKGGQFAKALSVFVGGGKTNGANNAITNGSVAVDLSTSTVDSNSLGLKGVVAKGAVTNGLQTSSTTSVSSILADTNNKTVAANTTEFVFQGPGFSGAGRVKVDVNLNGVTDTTTLVNNINAAITAAGNGNSPAATAFKNSNIKAFVSTDSTGKEQIAFSSANAAFQVKAGDMMSNALLGSFSSGTTGNTVISDVTGGALTAASFAAATKITVRLSGGGLASTKDFVLDVSSKSQATVAQDLYTAVSNDAGLKAAGITMDVPSGTTALKFHSASGEALTVQTTGDTANIMGLGAYQAASANAGAFDYSSITSGTTFVSAAQHLHFSFGGGSDYDLSVGASGGTTSALTAAAINTALQTDANAAVYQAAGIHAIDNGTTVTISSTNGTNFRLQEVGAADDLGFGNVAALHTDVASSSVSTVAAIEASGASQTQTSAISADPTQNNGTMFNFKKVTMGPDSQTVNVTAVDDSGARYAQKITLSAGSGSGTYTKSIDDAIAQINTSLQASNNSTLQKVVAVKDNASGSEGIRFMSTVKSFEVTVGSIATDGSGVTGFQGISSATDNTGQSTTVSAAQVGNGATADISTATGAQAAVTALGTAVTALGAAQAVVGRGENQFNYAMNLAQSQVTNEAASESQIRDADLAQAAANLTKAQILVQAGTAALAQANSAPQAILSLLQR